MPMMMLMVALHRQSSLDPLRLLSALRLAVAANTSIQLLLPLLHHMQATRLHRMLPKSMIKCSLTPVWRMRVMRADHAGVVKRCLPRRPRMKSAPNACRARPLSDSDSVSAISPLHLRPLLTLHLVLLLPPLRRPMRSPMSSCILHHECFQTALLGHVLDGICRCAASRECA
jgi:hypothetical protein